MPWLAAGLLALTGCTTVKPGKAKYIFFPPPPSPPRVQYLTSFAGGRDPDSVTGKFAEFVVGKQDDAFQPIAKPYGLAIGTSNLLYVCDTGTRAVDVLDMGQGTLRHFSPVGLGKLGVPINIAFDTDGTRYVTDTARSQVLCYGPGGDFVGGLEDTNGLRPTGVAIAMDRLYVSDLNTHCVRVYAKATRQLLFTIPKDPKQSEDTEPGKLYMPVNLALDARGNLYVSDLSACRVKVYDADGKLLRVIGDRGDLLGQFARPKGIAVDGAGRVFVVDAASQTCQIFDGEGKLLLPFGEPEAASVSTGTLNLPAAVCVDTRNIATFKKFAAPGFVIEELILISNQLGDDTVSVFGLGHQE